MNKITTYRMRTRDEFDKLIKPFDAFVREFTINLALRIEEKLHNLRTSRNYHHCNPYYATIKFKIPAVPLTYDESCFVKNTLKKLFGSDLYNPEFDITKCIFSNNYRIDNVDRRDYM